MKLLADVSMVYLHRDAVDFRQSIDGLVLIVEQEIALSPFADALFVFCNKNRDKLKLVYWDKTGFCLNNMRSMFAGLSLPKIRNTIVSVTSIFSYFAYSFTLHILGICK